MNSYYKETPPHNLENYGIEFFLHKNYGQGIMTHAHIHPAVEFLYIVKGIFDIDINSAQITANTGDLVLFRANTIHSVRHANEGEGEYFVLKIDPTLLFQIFRGSGNNRCVIPFINKHSGDISLFTADIISDETKRILDAMMYEYEHSDGFFYALERSFAAAFLVSLLRTVMKPTESNGICKEINEKSVSLIYDVVKYINENYALDITPAECAASVHLSYSYFSKIFRAIVGKTFKEYLTGVRLAKAHNSIISTELPITDIAVACGYNNLSYFIFEYRKIYKKTPGETRKELSRKIEK